MNATNRLTNRALLLVVGLGIGAAASLAALSLIRPRWADPAVTALAAAAGRLRRAGSQPVELAGIGETPAVVPVLLVSGAALLLLLLVFFWNLGGGKTETVAQSATPNGRTTIDANIADAVLAAPLRARGDVLAAHTVVYRVRGVPTVKLTVTARQGAELATVRDVATQAAAHWTQLAGEPTPLIVHFAGRGLLHRWRAITRVT